MKAPVNGFKGEATPVERFLFPFHRFIGLESSGGIVLLAAAAVALIWANSPWWESYHHLWETPLGINLGGSTFELSFHHFINDGLMVVFFFLVGLEIKREMLVGELSSIRAATLPIAAAIGGMVVPALIYAALNAGGEGAAGWGIPMATDIAFALGILALMGPRVPLALKVFLAALAIVDDLGAVLVIALFYTADVNVAALGLGGLLVGLLALANVSGVRNPLVYTLLGLVLWAAFLASGVHATIAGVLLAMTIPARTRIDTATFLEGSRQILGDFERAGVEGESVLTNSGQQSAIQMLESNCELAQAPLQRFEHNLQPWVAFFIIPLFALANAGVHLGGETQGVLSSPITFGVILGLVVGKVVGITLFSWAAVRARLASLPYGITWMQLHGVAWLGGIGFTMSLFVAGLAFGEGSVLLEHAKVGILVASAIAATCGWLVMSRTMRAGAAAEAGYDPSAAGVVAEAAEPLR